ncbi:MAG: hypothetical protein VX983_09230 [Actinomycetota bacterium]|nr:hypothetical protein [Acidimicrobiales bacterium]MED5542254.1 hypothetical protein [Actinomycetota bacterium]MEE2806328.1 hypothetical protein [Actinomycetota bacterium]
MKREIQPGHKAPPIASYVDAILSGGTAWGSHTSGVVPMAPDAPVPKTLMIKRCSLRLR